MGIVAGEIKLEDQSPVIEGVGRQEECVHQVGAPDRILQVSVPEISEEPDHGIPVQLRLFHAGDGDRTLQIRFLRLQRFQTRTEFRRKEAAFNGFQAAADDAFDLGQAGFQLRRRVGDLLLLLPGHIAVREGVDDLIGAGGFGQLANDQVFQLLLRILLFVALLFPGRVADIIAIGGAVVAGACIFLPIRFMTKQVESIRVALSLRRRTMLSMERQPTVNSNTTFTFRILGQMSCLI